MIFSWKQGIRHRETPYTIQHTLRLCYIVSLHSPHFLHSLHFLWALFRAVARILPFSTLKQLIFIPRKHSILPDMSNYQQFSSTNLIANQQRWFQCETSSSEHVIVVRTQLCCGKLLFCLSLHSLSCANPIDQEKNKVCKYLRPVTNGVRDQFGSRWTFLVTLSKCIS